MPRRPPLPAAIRTTPPAGRASLFPDRPISCWRSSVNKRIERVMSRPRWVEKAKLANVSFRTSSQSASSRVRIHRSSYEQFLDLVEPQHRARHRRAQRVGREKSGSPAACRSVSSAGALLRDLRGRPQTPPHFRGRVVRLRARDRERRAPTPARRAPAEGRATSVPTHGPRSHRGGQPDASPGPMVLPSRDAADPASVAPRAREEEVDVSQAREARSPAARPRDQGSGRSSRAGEPQMGM